MRIYVASSWKNPLQPEIVKTLRKVGHDVYDFRNPAPDNRGFQWREVDPDWVQWTPDRFRAALNHPIAERGFAFDSRAIETCDALVLVLPCGRSSHLELGVAVGRGKRAIVLMPEKDTPELMYKYASVCTSMDEVVKELERVTPEPYCDAPACECGSTVETPGHLMGCPRLDWDFQRTIPRVGITG